MNKIEEFAIDLIKKNNAQVASRIAKECAEASAPAFYDKLPIGNIFYREIDQERKMTAAEKLHIRRVKVRLSKNEETFKTYVLRVDELRYNNAFWKQVQGIIKREAKKL